MKTPTLPQMPVTKVDFDALFALQKANVDALVQAQKVLVEAVQSAMKLNYGLAKDGYATFQAIFVGKFDAEKKPEAYLAEMKTVAEKVMAIAQTQMDLGLKAQAEALDVLTKRAAANVDEVQKLAA